MAKAKKFGTFGGVFTPSILTILGVIMYLRLPWIVGQGGLWQTIAIIIIAHIISFTTGLSVASIATDKKVKAGGDYYIISRSLGLSVGGTLGFTLYAGLVASVSLYIIGFTESVLPFLGMESTLENIRLVGLIALAGVGIITFISTSLAIKTQYLILTALALSLLSIFLGGGGAYQPDAPLFSPLPGGEAFITLFGIFFPAVTGFTAGVQMSGDLKDPQKSIPLGTMTAISVGFLVYLCLAVFFAFRVSREALISDTNIVMKIAWFQPFVVAGIWGATISSAIGSVLGAPRILQAMSNDGITPRIFAKGHGKTNEPRNALILTILLSAIFVWMAELNIVARVVSIFFITSYGVTNLAFALENWASTDFRPSFRVPTWVGALGAATAFIVMIELDVVALMAGIIVLGTIFLVLKRRQLVLESGDAWQSVWSSLVQSGLNKLSSTIVTERNWRPNIILFSGGTSVRPHLVDMARWIAYKRGMVTNFDLVENPNASVLFERVETSNTDKKLLFPGFFSRKIECRDIYEGMDQITRVYGFTGIEPNTVLLGWAKSTARPERFLELLHQMQRQNYNLLLLKYHKERGFGECRTIDIWWRGGSNNAALALNLLKFIQSSEDWQESTARILIVIEESALANKVLRNLNHILSERRQTAEVKVINNAIEKRTFPEIIQAESLNTDLVMLGLPQFSPGKNGKLIERINTLIEPLGSVLLISASSHFKTYSIGIERQEKLVSAEHSIEISQQTVELQFPANTLLASHFEEYSEHLEKLLIEFREGYIQAIQAMENEFLEGIDRLLENRFEALEKRLGEPAVRFQRFASQLEGDIFFKALQLLEKYKEEQTPLEGEELQQGLNLLLQQWEQLLKSFPARIEVIVEESLTENVESGEPKHGPGTGKPLKTRKIKFPLRRLLDYHFYHAGLPFLQEQLQEMGVRSYDVITDLQKLFKRLFDRLTFIIETSELQAEQLTGIRSELRENLQTILQRDEAFWKHFVSRYQNRLWDALNQMMQEAQKLPSTRKLKRTYRIDNKQRTLLHHLLDIPQLWSKNKQLLSQFALMELHLIHFQNRIEKVLQRLLQDVQIALKNQLLDPLNLMEQYLKDWEKIKTADKFYISVDHRIDEIIDSEALISQLDEEIRPALMELPEVVEILTEESFQQLGEKQYEHVEVASLLLRRLVNRYVANYLLDPLKEEINELLNSASRLGENLSDLARLLRHSWQLKKEAQPQSAAEEGASEEEFLNNIARRIQEYQQAYTELQKEFFETVDKLLETLSGELNPYKISITSPTERLLLQKPEGKMVGKWMQKFRQDLLVGYDRVMEKMVFEIGKSIRWKPLTISSTDSKALDGHPLQKFIREVLPKPPDASHLPYFYRQLFLGKQPVGEEFWVDREIQEQQARQFIEQFETLPTGGLLITGEANSGKTAFCQKIVLRYFSRNQIHAIYPPAGGSNRVEDLTNLLSATLGGADDPEQALNLLGSGHVLVLHDLEMWWLRHPDGSPAMDYIIKILQRFSQKILFIATANQDSFRTMSLIYPLKDLFTEQITCAPFTAPEIARAIYLRHNSAGLPVFVGDERLLDLSAYQRAKIFNAFHQYAAGNPGATFHAWIAHITRDHQGNLRLNWPTEPDLQLLQLPDNLHWMLVWQIYLHKELSPERLLQLSGLEEQRLNTMLDYLKRFQIILVDSRGVVRLNPFLQHFLQKTLKELQWL